MLKDILSLRDYFRSDPVDKEFSRSSDRMYSRGFGGASAITLGSTAMSGNRAFGATKGGTFDYLSTAENTIDCYYQKIEDLKYYEAHDLTEKVIGVFRDYINQLWKEGSELVDIPGEDPENIKILNRELQAMDLLEVLSKDLDSVIYYGSVSYEITESGASDDYLDDNEKVMGVKSKDKDKLQNTENNLYFSIDPPKDRKYSFEPMRESKLNFDLESYYDSIKDSEFAGESAKAKAKRIVDGTSPSINQIVENTRPATLRGTREDLSEPGKFKTARKDGSADTMDKIGSIRDLTTYKSKYKLNKLRYPYHTIIEHDRKEGRRYLVRANTKYHIPTNKHNIFYYGNDSMKLMEITENKAKGKAAADDIFDILNIKDNRDKISKEEKNLGIDPKDPKKTPTRYELMKRELSAGVPLFYFHLPKVRELFLKDLVISILGIKDVIQPDILAMNFEGGMDIDQAQDMCNNLEDLLNKNSDYSIFNSAALDYNQLVKLLVDTVRILPDIEGKIQSLNPVRTTSLQDKILQVRGEYQDSVRNIISALGVPMDLFEGNSSKWEVIKRSERLQSRVNYYVNMIKLSIRRIAQSIYFKLFNRELRTTDFKVTIFNKSDLELAAVTNRLQSINELNQTLIQIIVGAERDLAESRLLNKKVYFEALKAQLKEAYPELDNLLNIDEYLTGMGFEDKDENNYGQMP